MESKEKRVDRLDLETAKAQMIDMMESIITDRHISADPNSPWAQLTHDLKRVESALALKNLYRDTRRRLSDMDIGGTGGTREEDRVIAKQLLLKMDSIPVELIED